MTSVEIQSASSTMVHVLRGKNSRGDTFKNIKAPLIAHYKNDAKGGHITVNGNGIDGMRQGAAKIYLKSTDYEIIGMNSIAAASEDDTISAEEPELTQATDYEISAELKETFEILYDISASVADGVIKGLVVSGPPGIGKSFTVEQAMEERIGVQASLSGVRHPYEFISGYLSPISLYCMLYKLSNENSVLVLDDADSILFDDDSLNLLKAALDTKKTRRIHWGTNSYILEKEGVPSSFEFKGSVIFITNLKFDDCKSSKIAPHLKALMSRAHYLDLRIDTLREKIIHITNIVRGTNMLASYNFSSDDVEEILTYVKENTYRLTAVDLRTIVKCADLKRAMPDTWTKMANRSLCKNR
jgi:hypothetical protein